MKKRSPSASHSLEGLGTKSTPVKWSIGNELWIFLNSYTSSFYTL